MKQVLLNNAVKLGMLFIGKIGGILAGIYFLPIFNKILGTEQFGFVALILSLQGLLLTIDFGMATLVGRDVAACKALQFNPLKTLLNSELVMSLFYVVLVIVAFIWWLFESESVISWYVLFATLILFWSLVLQNISFSALLGARAYITASTLQLTSVLSRAVITLFALKYISATVSTFIIAQFLCSLVFLIITRYLCKNVLLEHSDAKFIFRLDLVACLNLAKRGKPLIVASIVGALVMQFDKSIISHIMSAKELIPYFYSFTFSMTPILVLAGPVKQFYQPKFIAMLAENVGNEEDKENAANKLVKGFALSIMLVTVIPVFVLWEYREFFIELWLGNHESVKQIYEYSGILLPGFTIGAIGYIPVVFMTAAQDFKFQAQLSIITAIFTLTLVTIASMYGRIDLICYIYSFYFIFSTIACWYRVSRIDLVKRYSLYSFLFVSKLILVLICLYLFLQQIISG
ncbi:lipopolysaccharide biosynthesis protein [Shewanella sp. 0m-8]